jgi:lysophospholipase L1-like esterase
MVGEKLRRRSYDVEIINAAVPGHDSTDSLGKLMTDVWTLEPDIIFLCNAWNDMKRFPWISPEKPYRGLPPREPKSWRADWRIHPTGLDETFSASGIYRYFRWWVARSLYADGARLGGRLPAVKAARERIERRRRAKASAGVETGSLGLWGPKQYRLNLELIAGVARYVGAELALCKQAHLVTKERSGPEQQRTKKYDAVRMRMSHDDIAKTFDIMYRSIDEIADHQGLLVVDMNQTLSGEDEYFEDGIHFSLAGSRAASKLVAGALEPVVADVLARNVLHSSSTARW